MAWDLPLYFITSIIGIGLALIVAFVAWRRREVPGAVSMTGLMLAVAWWLLMGTLEFAATDLSMKIVCSQLQYLGIATVPVWWFLFALDYSGLRRRVAPRALHWLWLIPALTIIIAFTQGWHAWLWSRVTLQANGLARYEYGWWFLIYAAYSYILTVSGIILLIRVAWQMPRAQWRQIMLVTIASLFPLILNVIYLTGLSPMPGLDLTAVGFAIAGLAMVWNIFGFHLFDLSPVARDLLIESMDDGVIVLDGHNRIVDINPAGRRFIGTATSPIGMPAATALAAWPDLIEHYRSVEQARTEIRLASANFSEPTFVELNISPLRNRYGRLVGRLVTLHDVTRHRQIEMRLRQLSRAVEQSPAAIVITDLDGRIQYTNPKFTELTGYAMDEVIGHYSRVLKADETEGEEQVRRWAVLRAGNEWRGEYQNRKKNGAWYWESTVISPVTDAQGQITNYLEVREDITQRKQAEEIERRRAQRQALVSDLSMAINLSPDVQAIMQAAVDGLTRVLEVDQVGLALLDDTRQHLYVRADHPAPGNPSIVGTELPLEGNLSMQRVLETRRPLLILDAQHDLLMSPVWHIMELRQVQSILLVPLIVRDEVIGTIGFDALHAPRTYSDDEIDLAQTVANLVAVRLEQARLFDAERVVRREAQRHAHDLTGLYAVTRATSRSLALDDVLAQALSSALTTLQVEAGLIALAQPDDQLAHLQLAAARGLPADVVERIFDNSAGASVLAHTHQQREVRVVDLSLAGASDPIWTAAVELNALGWQTLIAIPLLHRDQSLGIMCLLSRQARTASSFDMALYVSMGHQVAAAISNAQLFQTTLDERSRLKALIEASRDGIIMSSVDGTILVMNDPALTLLRLAGTPHDWVTQPISRALAELRHTAPQAARAAIQEMRRLKTGAEPTAEGDYEVAGRPIHWQSLPVHVGLRPMGRLIVLRDMTEERALEQLREDMTHTLVHDLRNPLTAIMTALNMALEGFLGELSSSQRQLLMIAEHNSERMMDLISAILDVSRLESGRMPVDLMVISVANLIRDAVHMQAALASEKRIQIESDVPAGVPSVRADPGLMQRVLQNLIGNALKFTPEGGCVRVAARFVRESSEAGVVLISISDTGPGIPVEIQMQLFQKFVTGGQQRRGSGLGLAFCKLAVEAHGHRIWVDSSPGQGATFTFSLAAA
jgi:NtrC-family two-component system sensor histidine kinase KinB